ncbi:MAG TPA: energy transducer TonB [Longimicrobiales bacterium]
MVINGGSGASGALMLGPDGGMFSTLVASRPQRERRSSLAAGMIAIVAHLVVIALLVRLTMQESAAAVDDGEVIVNLLVPVEPPPPPAPALPDVAPPDAARVDAVLGSRTISAPTVILPDIPLPSTQTTFNPLDYSGVGPEGVADGVSQRSVTSDDVDAAPRLTPMTVRPTIRNRDDVMRALQRLYPALLRDAGIGGTVVLWIRVDEQGRVVDTRVHESSGQPALDEAALRVGEVIQFTPAMNRERRIPVWIHWPITFRPAQ